jgi:hypothetical protein
VRRSALVLALILVRLVTASPLRAQQLLRPTAGRSSALLAPARALTPMAAVPDSVRRKTGYQHWKGGAIGAGVGALGGLILALAAHNSCDDCTSDPSPTGKVTLIGAGLGGAFGFLVGLATPRYRWVPAQRNDQ